MSPASRELEGNGTIGITRNWPETSGSEAQLSSCRYYPTHEIQAELDAEPQQRDRLFSGDETRMNEDSPESAFVEAGQISSEGDVEICNHIKDFGLLKKFLEHNGETRRFKLKNSQKLSTFFFLYQQHSRSHLELSDASFKLLLSHINAFPELFEIFKGFGRRPQGVEDEGWNAYYSRVIDRSTERSSQNPVFDLEMAYVFRHVESVERNPSLEPDQVNWTIPPSRKLQAQMGNIFDSDKSAIKEYPQHWASFLLVCLGSFSTANWRAYINYISARIRNIHLRLKFAGVESRLESMKDSPEIEATFESLQTLQTLTDEILQAIHVLGLNCDVLKAIDKDGRRLQQLESASTDAGIRYTQLFYMLEARYREHDFCKKSLESLCKRADRISQMIHNTIAFRDSSTMTDIAQRSVDEAKSMKILAYTTVLFLPASFTAALLGMNNITMKVENGNLSVQATDNFILYLFITIPIMLITILCIWAWIRRRVNKTSRLYPQKSDIERPAFETPSSPPTCLCNKPAHIEFVNPGIPSTCEEKTKSDIGSQDVDQIKKGIGIHQDSSWRTNTFKNVERISTNMSGATLTGGNERTYSGISNIPGRIHTGLERSGPEMSPIMEKPQSPRP